MPEITVAGGSGRSVRLSGEARPVDPYPYSGSTFTATLAAEGLTAAVEVFMYGHSWQQLVDFVQAMADDWRGWDGQREWNSPEYHLRVRAESDDLGHCSMVISVSNGAWHDWETSLSLSVALGSDMESLSADLESWITDLFGESPRPPS